MLTQLYSLFSCVLTPRYCFYAACVLATACSSKASPIPPPDATATHSSSLGLPGFSSSSSANHVAGASESSSSAEVAKSSMAFNSAASSVTLSSSSMAASSSSGASYSSASSEHEYLRTNAGFELSAPGDAMPQAWAIRNVNNAAQIQVVAAPAKSGIKALEVKVLRVEANPWDIEVTYASVPVTPETTYSYRIWVKGDAGMKGHFTVGTPAPAYAERARQEVVFTGDWQEVRLALTTAVDDKLLRLATHLSLPGNANKTVYLDDLSFIEMMPLAGFSPVTVTQLAALSPNHMPIGVAVPAGTGATSVLVSDARKSLVQNHFNQITAENAMKMGLIHPEPNTYKWAEADALVAYAKAQGLSVHGHTLVWHSQTAPWMEAFEGTKTQWISLLEDHVKTVAAHFEEVGNNDTVMSWDVVNEAFMEDGGYRGQFIGESIWYKNIGAEFIERAFVAARAQDPDALLYYNDYNLIWSKEKLNAVLMMVQDFKNRNIPIDGVGFQAHISLNSPAIGTIREQFKKVMAVRPKIKLKITELDVRLNNQDTSVSQLTPAMAEAHKHYVYEIVKTYLEEVPEDQRGGISVWGITDADSWILGLYKDRQDWPLLFNPDFTPKPALQGFADALNEVP